MKPYKTDVHIKLEVDVLALARAKGVNISEFTNMNLKQHLAIDESKIPKEKDLLIERAAELRVESNLTNQRLKAIKDKEDKERQAQVKAQRQEEEDKRTGKIKKYPTQ